ncbi:MAG: glycerophosphodiester phosphodiesterase [Candidatus Saccharimonadales bacterium]
MQIIGHRGAAGLAPENTLASIHAALEAGVDWIEFDVHATKDGHVVLVHDPHTLRVGPHLRFISRTTRAQLQSLKTYSKQPIMTLEDAMDAVIDKAKINIEIKSRSCAEKVVKNIGRLVKKGYSYDRFFISSFQPAILRRVQQLNPNIPLALLHASMPLRFMVERDLNLSAVGFYHRLLSPALVKRARKRGLLVYAYTVNSKSRAATLARWGVQAIVTNYPNYFNFSKKERVLSNVEMSS